MDPELPDPAAPGTTDEAAATAAPSVPAVVVVMVTKDPGTWFTETLRSLAAQTYPDLSLLVVDNASAEDPTDIVRAEVPLAHVHRMEADEGYGAAANQATELVEGAAFYAFCHDDVALEPDTIRTVVEEAFRSNAGIIGPKLVDWDDPRRILQVGLGADKTGVVAPLAERGELDQEQHDAVRDVFVVPGGLTVVRADLFEALGGYDEGIDYRGEDLDLCWRTHLLGARVMIAPAARVRHREAFVERRPEERPRQRRGRHRLRTTLVAYGRFHRLRVLPQAALFSLIEVIYGLVSGHSVRARDAAGAWWWNLRRLRSVHRRRKVAQANRRVRDKEIRGFQARGSARFSAFIRRQFAELDPGEDRVAAFARSSRDIAGAVRSSSRQFAGVFAIALAVVLLVSSRDLIFGGVPNIGEFASFPDGPQQLLSAWWSGWRRPGLGGAGAQPTAYGLLGIAGYLGLGAMGVVRALLILITVPVGALGAWRLARPIGSIRPSVTALAVYLAIPVPYNAIASGSWSGLAVYAVSPWILLSLGRASGIAPYGPVRAEATERAARGRRRRIVPQVLGLGLLLGVVAAFVPFVLPMALAMTLALVLGGILCFRVVGATRLVAVGLGACVVAVVLNVPWSLDVLGSDAPWDVIAGVGATTGGPLSLGRILRFESGPWGAPPLGFAFLLAGALPVVIGRSWRLEWAVRAWFVVLAGWGLLWASEEGHLPVAVPSAEVILAPVAAALALAAALGLAAFETDLRAYRFGWRQLLSVAAALGVVLGAVPLLSGLVDGRWRTPDRDYAASLDPLLSTDGRPASRVLWVGHPEVLPVDGWRYDDDVAYAGTDRGAVSILDQFAGVPPGPTDLLADSLRLAEQRRTSRLGHLLAPMGVRYVVVASQLSPTVTEETAVRPVPTEMDEVLQQQLDFEQVPLREGVVVYRNTAWVPQRAVLPELSGDRTSFTEAVGEEIDGAVPALSDDVGAVGARGEVPAEGDVLVASASDDHWQLRIDGVPMGRSTTYGWANQFRATRTGQGELSYDTPLAHRAASVGQVGLWALVIVVRRRTRRRERDPAPVGRYRRRRRTRRATGDETPDPAEATTSSTLDELAPTDAPVLVDTPADVRQDDDRPADDIGEAADDGPARADEPDDLDAPDDRDESDGASSASEPGAPPSDGPDPEERR